ncbi:hypothetical protein CCDG5_1544 [[Clostridium] cellulosi]|jgi:hypothetical protein|uniref:Uncharacterized protein n=1 Tax=[Clostridium] cellulosi TaxID=29343 RepID=A0A078KU54_9FIRM|nr:hypothetical protein CCDG5_1544 [[Clostridium] cellulosi]
MSFANFKPEVWSTQLLMDRDQRVVGVQNCWRLFEGSINRTGDRVRIQGLCGATIKDLPSNGIIDDPEGIEDESLELVIDQKKYINFKVDDIDRIQSNADMIKAIIGKTSNNLAVMQDKYIYGIAKDSAGKVIDAASSGNELSSKNILSYLSDALAFIRSSSVYDNSDIFFEVHPYVFSKLQLAFTMIGQGNNTVGKNGYRGPLFGCSVFESNCIPVTDAEGNPVPAGTKGAIYHNIIRTGEAIAFAEQKSIDFKAYEVEKGFGEGVKGFTLYGAKVVKPQELVCLKAVIADE